MKIVQEWKLQYLSQYKALSSANLIGELNGALINTNFVLDYPRLQPTTFINVGGMQIAENPAPLPQDILEFIGKSGNHHLMFMKWPPSG